MLRRLATRALLPRLSAGTLPPWLARRAHAWLAQEPALARIYDALRRSERSASSEASLSGGQRDLLEALVLGAPGVVVARQAGGGARVPAWSGALAAAAVVLFVVTARAPLPGLGALEARGERLRTEAVGVKVTCLASDGHRVVDTATGGARQSLDELSCPRGSLLAFSTTNLGHQTRHMFVVGVGTDGERRWYAPFARDAAATPVPAGQVDALLPTLADTSTMPADERVSLFVLISDEPFDAARIERELASSAQRGVPLAHLERLPLVDVPLQARIDVVMAR